MLSLVLQRLIGSCRQPIIDFILPHRLNIISYYIIM
ncbi:hypothetical protein barba126A_phanotate64 [Rheinheimera phage vB_RspM_barba_12-6A]|uniref:Uncharacterized protein n=31 Tax=Barbavirus barba18A TaxID=2734090 RepID=A0A7G9VRS8_9CAUD|nr:hypothetical protein barba13A_phanotate15 [Rheinheimera phage vB_RspM_barba_1-3A]QNO01637.1 hypothetical protein barba108A_phanotate126 [Rheinheimera phage vB_RspM_barba_10-8A]QNO01764.1 hypothetical protein barba108B_phanotate93 [Rheinheimera phage vB_RspM_barba_10-8B]QNO01958.1 hypothetical protein barba108D_phanotate127 [Rheinheimera phage vB_RspM_barba_10-8D]QNO02007.1 hypothetical protein barba109A_phanotate15 [Rheinheimera phage vB_RspM_barba_10-9A]QNO02173.1 hypothetical protein barb